MSVGGIHRFGSDKSSPPFSVQVMSDIHLEFDGHVDLGDRTAPYLALLGDIGLCDGGKRRTQLEGFIRDCCAMYELVFFVSGNHESYHGSVADTNANMRELQAQLANFVYLDCDSYDVPGTDVRVLGCTLWSDLTDEGGQMLNDVRLIRGMDVSEYRRLHRQHVQYLEQQCQHAAEDKKRVVVFTHHAPFVDGLVPRVGMGRTMLLGGCLGTDLSNTFNTKLFPHLVAWCYGHTHLSKRTTISGVRVASNQWGYPHHSWQTWLAGTFLPGYKAFDKGWALTV
jgi:hypothetical protein